MVEMIICRFFPSELLNRVFRIANADTQCERIARTDILFALQMLIFNTGGLQIRPN